MVDIGLALAGKAVGGGGGGWDDAIGFLIFAGVAGGLVFWSARGEARKRRRYQVRRVGWWGFHTVRGQHGAVAHECGSSTLRWCNRLQPGGVGALRKRRIS